MSRTVLLIAVASLAACGVKGGLEAADRGVKDFHALFNEGRFDAIAPTADPELSKVLGAGREVVDREKAAALLATVQARLGKVTGSRTQAWKVVETRNLHTVVVVTQATTFEQGHANETFTYDVAHGQAVLVGYHVTLTDLLATAPLRAAAAPPGPPPSGAPDLVRR